MKLNKITIYKNKKQKEIGSIIVQIKHQLVLNKLNGYKKYGCFSDLHILTKLKNDDFGGNTIKFLKWLLKIIIKYKISYIVWVGDVFECWQGNINSKQRMADIRKAYPQLCEFIETTGRLLKGNHDYQLLRRKTMNIRLPGRGYAHVSHGCWNDKDMSNPFIRFGVWLYGATMERIFPNFENRWSKKNPKSKIYKMTKKYSQQILKKDKFKICICGHTHKAEIIRSKDGCYANTGTCQGGKFSGIILDTRTGTVKIVKNK